MKEIKKKKQKTHIRVSKQEYTCTYIGLRMQASCMHMQASCMHMHTSSLCTHAGSMRT